MVRRPSVTSTDSGARSSGYASKLAAGAGGGATVHTSLPGLGVPYTAPADGLVGSAHPAMLFVPPVAIDVAPRCATRDITVIASSPHSGQVGTGAPRLAITYDMPVIDQQSGRWYVRDIRASTQPMGTQ
jgi:hypothetical protein